MQVSLLFAEPRGKIKVALASGTLTAEEAAAYESELEIIKSREEKLSVKLEGLGLTTAGIALASSLMGSIDGKKPKSASFSPKRA